MKTRYICEARRWISITIWQASQTHPSLQAFVRQSSDLCHSYPQTLQTSTHVFPDLQFMSCRQNTATPRRSACKPAPTRLLQASGPSTAYQRNTKEGLSVILSISRFLIACQDQDSPWPTPGALLTYSSQGGSIKTTSNLVPKVSTDKGSSCRSACNHSTCPD